MICIMQNIMKYLLLLRVKNVENTIFGMGVSWFPFSKVSKLLINLQLIEAPSRIMGTMLKSEFVLFSRHSIRMDCKYSLVILHTGLEYKFILCFLLRSVVRKNT